MGQEKFSDETHSTDIQRQRYRNLEGVLVTVLIAKTKYLTKKLFKKGMFNFSLQFEGIQSTMAGKDCWWQEAEDAGHITFTVRKQSTMNAGV